MPSKDAYVVKWKDGIVTDGLSYGSNRNDDYSERDCYEHRIFIAMDKVEAIEMIEKCKNDGLEICKLVPVKLKKKVTYELV